MTDKSQKLTSPRTLADVLLPGVSLDYIAARYGAAPGNEINSGKFLNPESSACLVANAFGPFFTSPGHLPPLPGLGALSKVLSVEPETELRFPWAGGKHPCLDVMIETEDALIGVESKRYEPFRTKDEPNLSEAYDRDVWGERMSGYKEMLSGLRTDPKRFTHLDAAQLVKHAFALRTAVQKETRNYKRAILYYLYAEPASWPDGKPISGESHAVHRDEIESFARRVEGNEVTFHACSYRDLLADWQTTGEADVRTHGAAMLARFAV